LIRSCKLAEEAHVIRPIYKAIDCTWERQARLIYLLLPLSSTGVEQSRLDLDPLLPVSGQELLAILMLNKE